MSLSESIVEDAALTWSRLRQGCGGQVELLHEAEETLPWMSPL